MLERSGGSRRWHTHKVLGIPVPTEIQWYRTSGSVRLDPTFWHLLITVSPSSPYLRRYPNQSVSSTFRAFATSTGLHSYLVEGPNDLVSAISTLAQLGKTVNFISYLLVMLLHIQELLVAEVTHR